MEPGDHGLLESCIRAREQSRLAFEEERRCGNAALIAMMGERDAFREQLAQAQNRLEYYFTYKGENRPREFLDLEMRVISDGNETVSLAEWVSVIDMGIDAALRAKQEPAQHALAKENV